MARVRRGELPWTTIDTLHRMILDALLVTLGSGGAGAALVQAIGGWLRGRRSDVRVKLTTASEVVELDLRRVRDPREVGLSYKHLIDSHRDVPGFRACKSLLELLS